MLVNVPPPRAAVTAPSGRHTDHVVKTLECYCIDRRLFVFVCGMWRHQHTHTHITHFSPNQKKKKKNDLYWFLNELDKLEIFVDDVTFRCNLVKDKQTRSATSCCAFVYCLHTSWVVVSWAPPSSGKHHQQTHRSCHCTSYRSRDDRKTLQCVVLK